MKKMDAAAGREDTLAQAKAIGEWFLNIILAGGVYE